MEKIVGLQTDKPLKRALHPFGGINVIKSSFDAYGREMDAHFDTNLLNCVKPISRAYSTPTLRICCAAVNPACDRSAGRLWPWPYYR
ncbi:hypothetical protein ACNKHK_20185 [Shigella flexneri]